MFNRKRALTALYVTAGLVVIVGAAYAIGYASSPLHRNPLMQQQRPANNDSQNCDYNLPRLGGYNYIKPLLFAEQQCESDKFQPLKNKISEQIEGFKSTGVLTDASVYFRDLNSETWMSINGDDKFDPGSLLKVAILVTVLRINEDNPGFLDKHFFFGQHIMVDRTPHIVSQAMQTGRSYTVRELLEHMIMYSDNDATIILMDNISDAEFSKTHSDLGLEPVNKKSPGFRLSAKDYAVFFKVLYDGGYLTFRDSEYAISLLAKSDFKQGLLAGIPDDIKVAHKFGEGGSYADNIFELHEAAVVYLNDKPYLLTVMTQGPDFYKLPGVLSSISKLTFDAIASGTQAQ